MNVRWASYTYTGERNLLSYLQRWKFVPRATEQRVKVLLMPIGKMSYHIFLVSVEHSSQALQLQVGWKAQGSIHQYWPSCLYQLPRNPHILLSTPPLTYSNLTFLLSFMHRSRVCEQVMAGRCHQLLSLLCTMYLVHICTSSVVVVHSTQQYIHIHIAIVSKQLQ